MGGFFDRSWNYYLTARNLLTATAPVYDLRRPVSNNLLWYLILCGNKSAPTLSLRGDIFSTLYFDIFSEQNPVVGL